MMLALEREQYFNVIWKDCMCLACG